MADSADTADKILELIDRIVEKNGSSEQVLRLAEAYAWLCAPAQPHGGNHKSS